MAVESCVNIDVLVMGVIQNNVYIVQGSDAIAVVDPTGHADRIVEALNGRPLDAILITHAHFDHVNGAKELRELTGSPVIASAVDAPAVEGRISLGSGTHTLKPCPVDRTVEDGQLVQIGSMQWRAILTPGHTPGGMCYFLDPAEHPQGCINQGGCPVLLSGDTLFAGTHGRTDFVGGSPADMRNSLKRLAKLPSNTLVLPGHNDFTTIGAEYAWISRGERF